jgi:predicted 3-demethylubiquinone-9 3-methyltransferase (glyoxalase superfamily)
LTVTFELDGQRVIALNGGPKLKFSEAISLSVDCDTQEEIDYYWEKLTAGGGEPGPCGWLKDRFGLSWQIAAKDVQRMLQDRDPKRVARVFGAIMKTSKLDIASLKRVYEGS